MNFRIATKEEWARTRASVHPDRLALFDRGAMPVLENGVRLLAPGSKLPANVERHAPPSTTKTSREEEIARAKVDPNVSPGEFHRLLGFPEHEPPAASTAITPSTKTADERAAILWDTFDREPTAAEKALLLTPPPRPIPPPPSAEEALCRAWDSADGDASEHAKLAEQRAERQAAATKKPGGDDRVADPAVTAWNDL